ncbi:MAG: SprT-like domain-containing protein [Verrucomicrobia bacterium]|nr:SprT-like domain-containing protein [Verrucomicrobiota bacterium]MDA1005502.1 SprT-like domain-containing protein [Verrucomicrobiota bacterium]
MRGIKLWFGLGARSEPEMEPEPAMEDAPPGGEATLIGGARRRLTELGLEGLGQRVRVVWNRRMRSTAGRALWPEALIELNPALQEIGLGEVERTLLHELAHLVAFERAGRRRISPHGKEWQRACAELGIPGETASHRLELPSRTLRRKWAYLCPHCLERVERVRRMHRHSACWPCCRAYAGGRYDERFKFVEERIS